MVMRASFTCVIALTVLSALGCSSDDSDGGGSGGASTGGTGGSSTGGSSGSGGSAGMDAGADAGPLTSNSFLMSTGVFGKGANTNLLFINHIAEPGQRCAQRVSGPCRVVDCLGDPDAGEPPPAGAPAGTVEVSKGSTVLLSGEPAADGTYPVNSKDGQLWNPGDALVLSASGAAVPAFTQSLTAPGPIELDPSMMPDSGLATVKRSADYALKWKPLGSQVTITLTQLPVAVTDLRNTVRVVCEFDGQGGQGVVPKDAMSALKASSGFPGMTKFNAGGSSSADVTVGGYSIHVYALYGATYDVIVED